MRAYQEAESEARNDFEAFHRMFGWPDVIQNPIRLWCQLVSNGVAVDTAEGWRDPRVEGLRRGASEWRLLLQIDTDEDVGWMWGDSGRVYYWIREQDLRAGRFEKVWSVLQSY